MGHLPRYSNLNALYRAAPKFLPPQICYCLFPYKTAQPKFIYVLELRGQKLDTRARNKVLLR